MGDAEQFQSFGKAQRIDGDGYSHLQVQILSLPGLKEDYGKRD